jgi:hypothetical protein
LTSEIRRATITGEARYFKRLFELRKYCAAASWHSACAGKGVDVEYSASGSLILTIPRNIFNWYGIAVRRQEVRGPDGETFERKMSGYISHHLEMGTMAKHIP